MPPPQTNKPGDMLAFTSEWAARDIPNYEFVVLLNKEQASVNENTNLMQQS